jgi:hypothetical protein
MTYRKFMTEPASARLLVLYGEAPIAQSRQHQMHRWTCKRGSVLEIDQPLSGVTNESW